MSFLTKVIFLTFSADEREHLKVSIFTGDCQKFTQNLYFPRKKYSFPNFRILTKGSTHIFLGVRKLSVYNFLIVNENVTWDVSIFHCNFCNLKLTPRSSKRALELIQTFLPLLKNYFKISKSYQMYLFRIAWE